MSEEPAPDGNRENPGTSRETGDEPPRPADEAADTEDVAADTEDEATDTEDEATDTEDEATDTEDEATDTEDEATDTEDEATDTEDEATDTEDEATDTEDEARPVETDGEGVVSGHGSPEQSYPDDDVGGISTPPDDEEMPLADHIEEMILRFAVVLLFASAGTAIGLLWASDAISIIWADVFPEGVDEPPPHIYHPLELWLTRIKVAALLGIMVGLPMFVYQCYLFMKPGLYPNERKYYLAAVPTSVVLAGVGMLFSYLLVLPILFYYFTFYAEGSAEIAYALGETFDLVITLTAFLAIVFQIPLFIMLAIMMGVTTRRWLAEKRLYFWAAFFGLAFMFTFDPTAMAPVLVGIVMILLFEGTLLVLKWVGRE